MSRQVHVDPHEAGFYDEDDAPMGQIFATLAAPALRELARG